MVGIDRYMRGRGRPAKDLGNGTVLVATNTVHGPKQMRCPHCHGMCAPTRNAQGVEVYQCSGCQTRSSMRPM